MIRLLPACREYILLKEVDSLSADEWARDAHAIRFSHPQIPAHDPHVPASRVQQVGVVWFELDAVDPGGVAGGVELVPAQTHHLLARLLVVDLDERLRPSHREFARVVVVVQTVQLRVEGVLLYGREQLAFFFLLLL